MTGPMNMPEAMLAQAMSRLRGVFVTEDERKEATRMTRRDLRQILQLHPDLGRAKYYLGVTEMLLGRSEEAIGRFNDVLAMHPNQDFASEIYLNLGTCYADLGEREKAEEAWVLAHHWAVKDDVRQLADQYLRAS